MAWNVQAVADPIKGNSSGTSPFTTGIMMSVWFRAEDEDLDRACLEITDTSNVNFVFRIGIGGDVDGNPVYAAMGTTSGNFKVVYSNIGFIVGQWHNVTALFSGSNMIVFLDGRPESRNSRSDGTHPGTTGGSATVTIGDTANPSGVAPFKGDLAEAGAWKELSTTADSLAVAAASGISYIRVPQSKLWLYAPLFARSTTERNYGWFPAVPHSTRLPSLTVAGGPTQVDHAPVTSVWGWDAPPLRPGKGTTTVTPTAVSMSLDVVTPTTIYNDLVTPAAVSMSLDVVTPTAIGVAITPPAVSMTLDTVAPSVGRVITPAAVSMTLTPFTDILDGGIVDVRKEVAVKRTIVLPSPRTRLLG